LKDKNQQDRAEQCQRQPTVVDEPLRRVRNNLDPRALERAWALGRTQDRRVRRVAVFRTHVYMPISSISNTEKNGAGVTASTPDSVMTPSTRIGTIWKVVSLFLAVAS
jgi:hypothetical protein